MPALQGVGVLVTRPGQQATALCRLLEAAGATAWCLPAIDIQPVGGQGSLERRLGAMEAFDLIIFASANAVRFGSSLLGPHRDLKLAAIGPATARALADSGLRVSVSPAGGFDSESLLRHPALCDCAGRRVLLVKGMHGRELLQDELARRGALVSVAEVYRREPVQHDAAAIAALEARFAAGEIHVITATSVDIATGLLELATPALRRGFDHAHWLVPAERVAGALRERGVTAPILRARSALDQDLVDAIEGWRAGESAA
jgi:uroporphyrinogen-III synthase